MNELDNCKGCVYLSDRLSEDWMLHDEDWKHFFELRALGTTGKPHPQASQLAIPLMEEFKSKGWYKN